MIIDTHVHIYPPIIAKATVEKLSKLVGVTPYTDGTITDTLTKYNSIGIDRMCLLNIAVKENKEPPLNAYAKSVGVAGRVVSFASVNPNSDNAANILEGIKEAGFLGVKFHPEYQRFEADSKKAIDLYKLANELSLLMTFHAGDDGAFPNSDFAHPYRFARVLDKVDGARMILAHMGGMAKWSEVLECIAGRNCYLDTAMCATYMSSDDFGEIVKRHGVEKVLFGSDCPWENPLNTIAYIKKSINNSVDLEKILYKNASKLMFGD